MESGRGQATIGICIIVVVFCVEWRTGLEHGGHDRHYGIFVVAIVVIRSGRSATTDISSVIGNSGRCPYSGEIRGCGRWWVTSDDFGAPIPASRFQNDSAI